MADILIVDDEVGIRELLSEILGDEGHTVLSADSARQAREWRDKQRPDLVLLDIWMPDTDGVTLLKEWSATGKLTMPVIMMSGHATIDTAVEATRIGAFDFLEKPIALQKLLKAVEQGLARSRQPAIPARTTPTFLAAPIPPNSAPLNQFGQPQHGGHPNPATASGFGSAPYHAPNFGSGGFGMGNPSSMQGGMGDPSSLTMPAPVPVFTPVGQAGASLGSHDLSLDLPLREARDAFERAYFEHHLLREHGSMTRVAERTGLERTHLYRKLKQLGIDLSKGAYRKGGL
jgi:DNA-binding NtrC family response regulator